MMKTKCSILKLIAASAILFGLIGESNAQPLRTYYTNTLTPDLKVTADTSKRGFIWSVFANQANAINSHERTVEALTGRVTDAFGVLLGNLADPTAQGVALATSSPPSPTNAAIKFEIDTVINVNAIGGNSSGNFSPDDQMPGVPATDASNSGLAVEVLTYLNLPAGITRFGFASDDQFWLTAGKVYDAFDPIYLGARGPGSETILYVNVQEAGVYPFRLLYENGGGGAYIEWYTLLPDDTRVLVNDTANGGVAAYRASTTTSIPTYVKRVVPDPAPRQVDRTSPSLLIELSDGTTTSVGDASIALSFDGSPVTPVKTRNGSVVTVTYTPSGLRFPGEHHTASLSFTNSAGATFNKQWSFYCLKNIVLPAPVLVENFDSYAEGDVPTGWTAWNFTTSNGSGPDLENLNSDSYLGWIVVSKARLDVLKAGQIALPAAPGQMSNGVPITIADMCQGNILYEESDVRSGNQVQFITTKPFNLSSVANPALSYFCLYNQNQDNIGAVEYSVDGGTNWLPVVYYLDQTDRGGDIVLMPDGTIDAVATLTNANTDTAVWDDNGVTKGHNYGDGIAAPITQALGRFIAARNNDDPVFDKRLEIYRLPMASHKSDVRLRFAYLGTGSWYFGVDNLSFYDVAAPVTPKLSIARAAGNSVTISWTGDGTLLEAPTLAGPWTIPWSQANPQTQPVAGSKFYKIGPP